MHLFWVPTPSGGWDPRLGPTCTKKGRRSGALSNDDRRAGSAPIPPLAQVIRPCSNAGFVPLPSFGVQIRCHPHLVAPCPAPGLDAQSGCEDIADLDVGERPGAFRFFRLPLVE